MSRSLVLARGDAVALTLSPDAARIVEDWLTGKNAQTVADYRRDVDTFRAWLANAPDTPRTLEAFLLLDAGTAHVLAHRYRGAMLASGLSPASVNRKLSALRSVIGFAYKAGRVEWELTVRGVEAQPYRDTRGPGADGVRAMLASLAPRRDAKTLRDFALVRLLFDSALRRAEAVGLDLEHVDLQAGTLAVLGKKRRERERVTLQAPTRAALAAWLEVRGNAPGPLFTNFDRAKKGQRLTGRSVARIVARLGERAGLGTVRPHGLRHAAITAALDLTGGDVRKVQRYSRHRDLRTLTVYDDARTDLAGQVGALVAGSV